MLVYPVTSNLPQSPDDMDSAWPCCCSDMAQLLCVEGVPGLQQEYVASPRKALFCICKSRKGPGNFTLATSLISSEQLYASVYIASNGHTSFPVTYLKDAHSASKMKSCLQLASKGLSRLWIGLTSKFELLPCVISKRPDLSCRPAQHMI